MTMTWSSSAVESVATEPHCMPVESVGFFASSSCKISVSRLSLIREFSSP